MSKLFLVIAGINGFLAVSLGAFGAHGLENVLSSDLLETFNTGVEYHMYHSLALFGIGLLAMQFPNEKVLRLSGYLFLVGIVLFSGSLYLLCLTGISALGAITPIGGVAFLVAWACLSWFGLNSKTDEH